MLIDYFYLILILVLICSILLLIYLSYEYRTIEPFYSSSITLPLTPIQPFNPSSIIKQGPPILNSYNSFLRDTNNKQVSYNNLQNQALYGKTNSNLNDIAQLSSMKQGIVPIPQSFPVDKLIKTIKSKYNSQYLSTFANDLSTYGVLANDKCITVNGLCKEEVCLLDCQKKLYSSNSQKFTTNRIMSPFDAAKIMNVTPDKIATTNIYPYNIFRSSVNNNCLSMSDDGITVAKCNLNNIQQQWQISPNENICILK